MLITDLQIDCNLIFKKSYNIYLIIELPIYIVSKTFQAAIN